MKNWKEKISKKWKKFIAQTHLSRDTDKSTNFVCDKLTDLVPCGNINETDKVLLLNSNFGMITHKVADSTADKGVDSVG